MFKIVYSQSTSSDTSGTVCAVSSSSAKEQTPSSEPTLTPPHEEQLSNATAFYRNEPKLRKTARDIDKKIDAILLSIYQHFLNTYPTVSKSTSSSSSSSPNSGSSGEHDGYPGFNLRAATQNVDTYVNCMKTAAQSYGDDQPPADLRLMINTIAKKATHIIHYVKYLEIIRELTTTIEEYIDQYEQITKEKAREITTEINTQIIETETSIQKFIALTFPAKIAENDAKILKCWLSFAKGLFATLCYMLNNSKPFSWLPKQPNSWELLQEILKLKPEEFATSPNKVHLLICSSLLHKIICTKTSSVAASDEVIAELSKAFSNIFNNIVINSATESISDVITGALSVLRSIYDRLSGSQLKQALFLMQIQIDNSQLNQKIKQQIATEIKALLKKIPKKIQRMAELKLNPITDTPTITQPQVQQQKHPTTPSTANDDTNEKSAKKKQKKKAKELAQVQNTSKNASQADSQSESLSSLPPLINTIKTQKEEEKPNTATVIPLQQLNQIIAPISSTSSDSSTKKTPRPTSKDRRSQRRAEMREKQKKQEQTLSSTQLALPINTQQQQTESTLPSIDLDALAASLENIEITTEQQQLLKSTIKNVKLIIAYVEALQKKFPGCQVKLSGGYARNLLIAQNKPPYKLAEPSDLDIEVIPSSTTNKKALISYLTEQLFAKNNDLAEEVYTYHPNPKISQNFFPFSVDLTIGSQEQNTQLPIFNIDALKIDVPSLKYDFPKNKQQAWLTPFDNINTILAQQTTQVPNTSTSSTTTNKTDETIAIFANLNPKTLLRALRLSFIHDLPEDQYKNLAVAMQNPKIIAQLLGSMNFFEFKSALGKFFLRGAAHALMKTNTAKPHIRNAVLAILKPLFHSFYSTMTASASDKLQTFILEKLAATDNLANNKTSQTHPSVCSIFALLLLPQYLTFMAQNEQTQAQQFKKQQPPSMLEYIQKSLGDLSGKFAPTSNKPNEIETWLQGANQIYTIKIASFLERYYKELNPIQQTVLTHQSFFAHKAALSPTVPTPSKLSASAKPFVPTTPRQTSPASSM